MSYCAYCASATTFIAAAPRLQTGSRITLPVQDLVAVGNTACHTICWLRRLAAEGAARSARGAQGRA